VVATRGAGVLKVCVAQMVERDSVLDIGESVEARILVWAEAKEVAANEVEARLEVHNIPASTLGELKVLKHFQQEVEQKIPMEHSPVDIEECYSENLASEAHIELLGS
jgi:hypothetical protein